MDRTAPAGLASVLTRLATSRDEAAWLELLELSGGAIYRVALRILGDESLAEDAVQETLLQIREYAARFVPDVQSADAAARGWIVRLTCSTALQMLRKRRQDLKREAQAKQSVPQAADRAEALAEDREAMQTLRGEVSKLPERYRLPIIMHFFGGLKLEEVASELRCPVGTAKTHVHRGLEELRKRLANVGVALPAAGLPAVLEAVSRAPITPPVQLMAQWKMLIKSPLKPALASIAKGGLSIVAKLSLGLTAAALVGVVAITTTKGPGAEAQTVEKKPAQTAPASAKGPLAGLPSAPGAQIAKLEALGDDTWLNLGAPAPDAKWGLPLGRPWCPRMPYAPDLRGAFLFGEAAHGWVNPATNRTLDDLWFYDVQAHRWVCVYPGASMEHIDADYSINSDGFTALKDGSPLPICAMVHAYEQLTYDSDLKRFMSFHLPMYGSPQLVKWLGRSDWYGPCKAQGSPWFYDVATGKWGRETLKGTYPSNIALGDVMVYVSSKKKIFYHAFGSSRNHSYFYDPSSHEWREVKSNWTEGNHKGDVNEMCLGDAGACYDSKRDRVYITKANRIWYFDLKTSTWNEPKPPGEFDLNATYDAVVNYDLANEKVVIIRSGRTLGVGKVYVYDPEANTCVATANAVPKEIVQMNGFYDPVLNVYFVHNATDCAKGVVWAYRYKAAKKK